MTNALDTLPIQCLHCGVIVNAIKVAGTVIYPLSPDLARKDFYQCPKCRRYVCTHADGRPLGTIPTDEIKRVRMRVHDSIDPLWKSKLNKGRERKRLYRMIAEHFGLDEFHVGWINDVLFAEKVVEYVNSINNQ